MVKKAIDKTNKVLIGTGNTIKKGVKYYTCEIPNWAKWIRNIGIIVNAAGGTILSYEDKFPDFIVNSADYMVMCGIFTALIIQSLKKKS